MTTTTTYISRLIYITTLLLLFRARTNVNEVYGELTDLDDIDWMKIAKVDVRGLFFLLSHETYLCCPQNSSTAASVCTFPGIQK